MTDNPYATPESNVEHHSGKVENGSIFRGNGRLSVAGYFGQYLLLTLISVGINLGGGVAYTLATGGTIADMSQTIENPLFMVGLLIFTLITGWVGVCMAIKRFHDRNLSGWWVLSLFIIIGVVILFIPGKEEPNRFGAWRRPRTWEKILAGIALVFLIVIPFVTTLFTSLLG